MWMYISEGVTKKISCSIVMTQWSNLYLFYALNEFNSQCFVPVHWLGRCVLSDWICSMTATHFLSPNIDFSNRSTLPAAWISNVSPSPHAGAHSDLSSCLTSLCAPERHRRGFVLLRDVQTIRMVFKSRCCSAPRANFFLVKSSELRQGSGTQPSDWAAVLHCSIQYSARGLFQF